MCYTCPGFREGAVKEHSAALLRLREGFREFLGRWHSDMTEYDKYIERLQLDSNPDCPGCRKIDGKGRSCVKDCLIPECVKEHGVDFCGECGAFPCDKIGESGLYSEAAQKGFREGGTLIKEYGAEGYFQMKKDVSHYIYYK
jgi:hypothetical protein